MGAAQHLNKKTIHSRGKVQIIYSTTSYNSKTQANKLQQLLQEQLYFVNVSNISEYANEYYLNYQGTIIFLLSTYGDGDSPEDGQGFYNWVTKVNNTLGNVFEHMSYMILAFGNSTFDNFCGFGVKTNAFLKRGGAKELYELTKCDANSKEKDTDSIFPIWAKSIIQVLNSKNELRQFSKQNLASSYVATLTKPAQNFNWESNAKGISNLDHFVKGYVNLYNSKVQFIKQMRKENDGRSSLWVRLKVDKSIQLWPACNVEIYPKNKVEQGENDKALVTFNEVKGKFPFPPMPLGELKKIINFSQPATNKHIKSAILYSELEEVAKLYKERLDKKLEIKVSCKKLLDNLQPKPQFYCELGLNAPRIYTLASWDPNNNYVDLCVSLVKHGLTSQYLKSFPEEVKIKVTQSGFYIPQNRPIIMIANGSGISPFRSIAMYVTQMPIEKRPKMKLYYGIQNESNDYYFEEDWKVLQQQKIVEVFLAQSRNISVKKQYVQNLLEDQVEQIKEHLFTDNGVIFVCGGKAMFSQVEKIIFKSVQIHAKIPYKAFTLSSTLKQNKTIVAEVFG